MIPSCETCGGNLSKEEMKFAFINKKTQNYIDQHYDRILEMQEQEKH